MLVSATKERLQNSLYRLIMTLISIILLLLFSSIRYIYGKLVEGNIWLSVCMESIVYGVYRHFLNLCCKSFTTQARGISVHHKLICINILSSLLSTSLPLCLPLCNENYTSTFLLPLVSFLISFFVLLMSHFLLIDKKQFADSESSVRNFNSQLKIDLVPH